LYQVRITEELIKYDNQFKSMHLKFIQA
jgi:hypothetical protein